jgi:putative membrane protein
VLAVVRSSAAPRRLTALMIAALALVLFDPRAAYAEPGVPNPPNNLLTDTGEGNVAEADADFVTKVKLAGLWEIPAGEMAQTRSNSNRIKKIGEDIAAQHESLDALVEAAAKKLDIELPDKPNKDQQGWLDEMEAAKGEEFDQIYVDRLRAAHGKIFPAIATIRTSTRNDTVRKLAQRTNQFVMTHLTLLESSGIVDFESLQTAPPPNAAAPTTKANPVLQSADAAGGGTPSVSLPVVGVVVVVGVGVAFLLSRKLMQDPRRRRRTRNRSYQY